MALPEVFADVTGWSARTRVRPAVLSPQAERRRLATLFGTWLAVNLGDAGFDVDAPPGRDAVCRRGAAEIAPIVAVAALSAGEISSDGWSRRCAALRAR